VGIFLFLYYGSVLAYGAGYPGGLIDSPFIHKYFYWQEPLRQLYIRVTAWVFEMNGVETVRKGAVGLFTRNGGVHVNDACLGFGLFSFWIAFTMADNTAPRRKLSWLAGGMAILLFLNQLRIIVILAVMHYRWANLYTIDHHFVFNIICYLAIFMMIWLYARNNIGSAHAKHTADTTQVVTSSN
jgi:exosortase/archaeosortase family protein